MTKPVPALAARKVSKTFPGVRALHDVDLELAPGRVRALVGENGAGKSTLIKIFGGLLAPTEGHVEMDGQAADPQRPSDSQSAGISVIAQEFELVSAMTVVENIFLGHEPRRRIGLIDWPEAKRRAVESLGTLGVEVSPTAKVSSLSVADQQLVEIAKALSLDFRVLIMDEPTAALSATEVERLFAVIRRLKERGTAVLYVSHRLHEIFGIADDVTVLRDGEVVAKGPITDYSEDELVTAIVGSAVDAVEFEQAAEVSEQAALSVQDMRVNGAAGAISLDLHYGEVVGLAGLIGSGRSELLRAVVGLSSSVAGGVLVDGKKVDFASPGAALRGGVALLPEDRKSEGNLPDLSVSENLALGAERSVLRRVQKGSDETLFHETCARLRIVARSPDGAITDLSGGNQQKVLVGRALATHSRILLLNEPTRGVDVGAKVEIHKLIRELAADGYAILVSSSDVPELILISDRCLVLGHGRVVGQLAGDALTEGNVVARALGRETATA